jgi:hypothetical protein
VCGRAAASCGVNTGFLAGCEPFALGRKLERKTSRRLRQARIADEFGGGPVLRCSNIST